MVSEHLRRPPARLSELIDVERRRVGRQNAVGAWMERIIAPAAKYLGFKSDLDLPAFLVQAGLKPVSIEKVNVPRIWSLVTCVKD